MSDWKEDANRRRDIRRGVTEQPATKPRNATKKATDWLVVTRRWRPKKGSRLYYVWGEYRTEDIANRTAEQLGRKYGKKNYVTGQTTAPNESFRVVHRDVFNRLEAEWKKETDMSR